MFAGIGRLQSGHCGSKDTDITGGSTQRQPVQGIVNLHKYLGVSCGRVLAVKNLIANLKILICPRHIILLPTKNLTGIGIACRLGPLRHMHLDHRHSEIRTQHLFAAQRIRGHIGAGANILAVQVQQ